MNHAVEHVVDAGAIAALIAALLGAVPHFTAVLTLVWVIGRLYQMFTGVAPHETATVRAALRWLNKWRFG